MASFHSNLNYLLPLGKMKADTAAEKNPPAPLYSFHFDYFMRVCFGYNFRSLLMALPLYFASIFVLKLAQYQEPVWVSFFLRTCVMT